MKKVVLLLSVTIVLLFGSTNAGSAEHEFFYEVVDGGVMITDCIVDQSRYTLRIPSVLEGEKVVGLGRYSLGLRGSVNEGLTNVTKIIIPSSVCSIAEEGIINYYGTVEVDDKNGHYKVVDGYLIEISTGKAIYSEPHFEYVEQIVVPPEVRILGDGLFNGIHSFGTIVLPKELVRIGRAAFGECFTLREITIPESVQIIEDYAFLECIGLEKVVFPEGLLMIGKDAFSNCEKLVNIDIPSNVSVIDRWAFSVSLSDVYEVCAELELPNGLLYIGPEAFYGRKIQKIILPPSLAYVEDGAFAQNPDATVYYYSKTQNIENAVDSSATLIRLD